MPRYMDNLIAAARSAGARLVVLENVYMLGRPGGRPLDEDSRPNPCSRKREIRARAAERLFEAHRRGDVLATTGRASDFYGPGGTLTHLGDHFWRPALAGKTARVLVDPEAIHTYHYIPDFAAGLATLGRAGAIVYGRPWMLPGVPAGSMRELVARLSRKLGRQIRLGGAGARDMAYRRCAFNSTMRSFHPATGKRRRSCSPPCLGCPGRSRERAPGPRE